MFLDYILPFLPEVHQVLEVPGDLRLPEAQKENTLRLKMGL